MPCGLGGVPRHRALRVWFVAHPGMLPPPVINHLDVDRDELHRQDGAYSFDVYVGDSRREKVVDVHR